MSIYKRLASWAEERERNLVAKAARKKEQKARKFKHGAADAPLTKAFFVNSMHSFDGIVCKLFEASGALINKRVTDSSEDLFDKMSALIVKQQSMTDERTDDAFHKLGNEFTDVARVHAVAHTENLARIHEDIVAGQRQLHNIQMTNMDRLNVDSAHRFLELCQHLRDGRLENLAALDVLYQVMATHFDMSNARLEGIERAISGATAPVNEPSLEWLMSNVDGLERFVDGIRRLRNNDAPPTMSMQESIRSIQAFADYPIAIVKKAVDSYLAAEGLIHEQLEAA